MEQKMATIPFDLETAKKIREVTIYQFAEHK